MKSIADRATPGVYERKLTSLRVRENTSAPFVLFARFCSVYLVAETHQYIKRSFFRRETSRGYGGAGLEGDGGTQPAEFLFEVLVAAQYVPGGVHDSGAIGYQAREY